MIDVISRAPGDAHRAVRGVVLGRQMDRFWKRTTDHQGDDFRRRAVRLARRALSIPQRQRLAARLPAAAPAGVDHRPLAAEHPRDRRARLCARHLLSGFQTKELFDHYRKACADLGRPAPAPDRFSYLGIVAIAQDRKEAMRRAEVMVGYLRSSGRVAEPFGTPPGYFSVKDAVRMIKARGKRTTTTATEKRSTRTTARSRTSSRPASCSSAHRRRLRPALRFIDNIGGLGHFLMMGHAGHMTHRGSRRPESPSSPGSPAATAETSRRIQAGGMIFSPPFKGGVARSAGVVALLLSLSALAHILEADPARRHFSARRDHRFHARALAPRLSEALGQPVIVENKTGSGGNIGTDFVAKAPPDGHTLLVAAPPNAINVSLYRTLPFDTKKDLVPVALVGSGANVLVVSAKTPVNNVRELVEHARRNPGKLNFASNGNGTSIHLSGELLKYYGKFDAAHVSLPRRARGDDCVARRRRGFMFDALSISAPQIRAGRIRLLAVTSRERSAMFPEAPTLVESGFPEFEVSGWTGVMTTGGTPQAIIARLEAELRRILSDRELIAAFEKPGMTASFAGAREFGEFLDAEIRRGRWR